MAGSNRMLLSTLVPGIIFTGGIAILPIAETASAPVPAITQDAVLADLATPEPDEAVQCVQVQCSPIEGG